MLVSVCLAGYAPIRYFENFPDVKPFGARSSHHNKAEWIVDLTTRADREGKHMEYANHYDASDLKTANLKELDLQLDRGYRVSPPHLYGALHAITSLWLHVRDCALLPCNSQVCAARFSKLPNFLLSIVAGVR